MNRAMIRARIDALECLTDTQTAIEEVASVEFAPHETGLMDLRVSCNSSSCGIASVLSLPPAVVLAGLRAMEAELCELGGMQVTA